jgi:hypothetical protein
VEAARVKRWLWGGFAFLLLATVAGCRSAPAQIPPASVDLAVGWTLLVNDVGPRWLGSDWWRAQGLDPEELDSDRIHLTDGAKTASAFWLESADGPGLLFYGAVEADHLGPVGSYHLTVDAAGDSATLQVGLVVSLPQYQTETTSTLWLEQDNTYRPTAPQDANWLWTSFNAAPAFTLTVPLTEALAAPVTLTLRFWGQSSMPQNPDHHIRVLWNGAVVDDHLWDGSALEEWTVITPQPRSGDNELVLISPGDTEAPVEVTWLDRVGVTWQRALTYTGERWESWTAGDEPVACWEGVAERVAVLLVGQDGTARGGLIERPADGRLCVEQRAGDRGWIGAPEAAPPPDIVRPRETVGEASLLAADYLIVAPRLFHTALAPLVEARIAEGLSAVLVTPEQVYDAFGTGKPAADAIREAVVALHTRGRLRYLLLVGDASAHPDTLWQPESTLVPTGWVRTFFVGDTPSDHALVINDGAPLIAVGRFPASTVAEVQAMVAKTLAWEPTPRLLLLHDDEAEFVTMTDALAALSAPDLRLGDEGGDIRRALLRWLRAAPGVLVYSGHGSLPVLGDEKFLTVDDAGAWDGPTVVAAWTCLCANFGHPTQMGLSEAWMRHPKGAVAVVGPTGETTTGDQSAMALAFQQAMLDGETIGDALLAGWRAAQSKDAEISFVLLGDPALRLMPDQ